MEEKRLKQIVNASQSSKVRKSLSNDKEADEVVMEYSSGSWDFGFYCGARWADAHQFISTGSYLPARYSAVLAVIEIRDGSPTPEYDTTQAFRNGADEWIADNYNGQNEKIHLKVVAWMPVPKYKPSEQL